MRKFDFPTTEEAYAYWCEIADRMVLYFGISENEAVGRINKVWGALNYMDEMRVNLLMHETVEYWAKTTYYCPGPWWKDERNAKPRSYP